MTAAEFKVEFPEFSGAPDALVTAKLADATARLNPDVWGDRLSMGIKYMAARMLARAPNARAMKLVDKDGNTIYDEEYRTLMLSVSSGFRVVGT